MAKKLWEASKDQKLNSNLCNYEKFISEKFNLKFNHNYKDILNWSIKNPGNFWSSIWDFCKIKGFEAGDIISEFKIENLDRPNKAIVYPFAILLLFVFGYLNYRRKSTF